MGLAGARAAALAGARDAAEVSGLGCAITFSCGDRSTRAHAPAITLQLNMGRKANCRIALPCSNLFGPTAPDVGVAIFGFGLIMLVSAIVFSMLEPCIYISPAS
jgi:hypothetical protein